MMDVGGVFFFVVYSLVVVGVAIYLIVLAARFVGAHERGADALERIAQTLSRRPRD